MAKRTPILLLFLLLATFTFSQKRDSILSAQRQKDNAGWFGKYPVGVTKLPDTTYGNCTISRWVVISADKSHADEYKQKVYTWKGEYYFKNGISITKRELEVATGK
jgi:hypothetical protein